MRICYLGNIHSIHLNVFIDHFAKAGHEVHVFAEQPPSVGRENVIFHDLFPFHTANVRSNQEFKAKPKNQKRMSARISRSVLDVYSFFRIRSLISRIRPDIVHGHEANDWGLMTALLRGYPRILTCWGSDVFRAPDRRLTRARVRYALRHVDLVHVTYPYTKEHLVKVLGIDPDRIAVRTWGLDLGVFDRNKLDPAKVEEWRNRLGLKDSEKVLLYAKGFREDARQNYLNLTRAFLEVSKDHPDLRLVMLSYGMSDSLDRLKDLLEGSGSGDRVRIVDSMLPQSEMPYALSLADSFAVLEDTDQFSGVILEGMMMGSIPLLSDIPQYRMTMGHKKNCIFVDQKSVLSLEGAIRDIIGGLDAHKERMLEANRTYAMRSDRSTAMKAIEEMYEDLARTSDKSTR